MTAGETGPGGVQQWGHTVLAVTTCPARHRVGSSPEEAQTQLTAGTEKWRWGHSIFFEEAGTELVFTSILDNPSRLEQLSVQGHLTTGS